jgi:hypothetical protein
MTNINTEEIFSVHLTPFFLLRRNTARTHPWPTPTPEKEEARSNCLNTVLWFSFVMMQSIS